MSVAISHCHKCEMRHNAPPLPDVLRPKNKDVIAYRVETGLKARELLRPLDSSPDLVCLFFSGVGCWQGDDKFCSHSCICGLSEDDIASHCGHQSFHDG